MPIPSWGIGAHKCPPLFWTILTWLDLKNNSLKYYLNFVIRYSEKILFLSEKSSTWTLVDFTWLLDHVTYLKLRKKDCYVTFLEKLSKFTKWQLFSPRTILSWKTSCLLWICSVFPKGHITVIFSQLEIIHVIQQSIEVSLTKCRPPYKPIWSRLQLPMYLHLQDFVN